MFLTKHFQNAYVTADLDRAVDHFMRELQAPGDPVRMESSYAITTERGVAEATTRVAFIQTGHLQYELIEPVAGDIAIYTDALRTGQLLQLHHIAMRTEDIAAVRRESERLGRKAVLHGTARAIEFLYIDARDTLGHYLEYVQAPEGVWRAMNKRSEG